MKASKLAAKCLSKITYSVRAKSDGVIAFWLLMNGFFSQCLRDAYFVKDIRLSSVGNVFMDDPDGKWGGRDEFPNLQ